MMDVDDDDYRIMVMVMVVCVEEERGTKKDNLVARRMGMYNLSMAAVLTGFSSESNKANKQ